LFHVPLMLNVWTSGARIVVTVQVGLFVVDPIVTVAVVAVLLLADEVCRMAMVSPLLKPLTEPATNAAPFLEIAVHPALQVAVRPENPPARVTVLLVMVELLAADGWSMKLKALAVGVVVTLHVPEIVDPTVTVAVVAVL
jgi:hypothetical protein